MRSEAIRRWMLDIIGAADQIDAYLLDTNYTDFVADRMRRDAVVLQVLTASEAAIRLGVDAEKLIPNHDWAGLRGIGNYIRHAYDSIHEEIIWNSARLELPELRRLISEFLYRSPEL